MITLLFNLFRTLFHISKYFEFTTGVFLIVILLRSAEEISSSSMPVLDKIFNGILIILDDIPNSEIVGLDCNSSLIT